jgi:predicted RNA binding protein YcfA (HicA-like mRNA interferase family)
MGKKLPVISGKDLLSFYIRMGCELKRIKGSHHVIKSIYNESMFVIPVHSNEKLDRGLLRAIIRQSGLEVDDFIELWKDR